MGNFSCTKLDETSYDKPTSSAFYATPEGVQATLAQVYNASRGDWGGVGYAGADRGWFDINEVTTDELMLPTRDNGSAWDDGGVWRQMYKHSFDASHAFFLNTWNWLYKQVYNTNQAVALLTEAKADPSFIAEARVNRAFIYYMLMDGWGSVPFYTENNITVDKVPQVSRQTLFNFIESELKNSVDNLPETIGGTYYGRFNKWAGYALLSRLYMNAKVYIDSEKNDECIAACDKIINSNKFSLVSMSNGFDYQNNNTLYGDKSPLEEVILSIYVDANLAPRNIIGIRSLAGPDGQSYLGFGTWNGACAHQDFVNKYDNNDLRKKQWRFGQVFDAQGNPLVNYDLSINSVENASTFQGARNIKFFPVKPYNGGAASNDFPIFRYAEILLNKAEASARKGDFSTAKTYVDMTRARAGLNALASTPSLNDIYDERSKELSWEGLRRQEMIRFGKFTAAHDFKPQSPSGDSRNLFPIPQDAITRNPNLKQNPGY